MAVYAKTHTEETILDNVTGTEYRLLIKNGRALLVLTDGTSYWDPPVELNSFDPETGDEPDWGTFQEILLELFT